MAVIEAIVLGTLLGLVYATLSVGFSLTWGTLDVIHVSHGAFVIFGAYLGYTAHASYGIDPVLALVAIVPLFFVIGVALYELLFRPLADRAREVAFASMVLSFGLAIAVENLLVVQFSADPRVLQTGYTRDVVNVLGVPVTTGRLVGAGLALLTLVIVFVFLKYTYTGRAVLAVAQNAEGAALSGIDERRVSAITFGLGLATAAIAGVATAMFWSFTPSEHLHWMVFVFIVTILGGVGSVVGAGVAGLLTGLVYELSALVVPFAWVDFVLFVLLVCLLVVKPEGLFQQ
ncbi:branched-chain amino acid ABC-type transport system, permease component [Halovivax ruber XH-70]|uniref:Branched-chain amino acid ABC-type transport system, permease component n=2 Tax=Halovivax TaxID=332951 RepID=L0IF85_HALRX|nr:MULTISPECIES: branched-chain amino acid ABC transporter permease [Halovivax]AGB17419.1 branched-chain amino acid ABC-type transport system, permease component [Halovivax ruber XH-70]ELZ09221.1 inner-membrane translocator [Halovivax asiaticus JCM 14624]